MAAKYKDMTAPEYPDNADGPGAFKALIDDIDVLFVKRAGGSLTGRVFNPAGSITQPSVSFVGDGETGFYRFAPGRVAFVTGGKVGFVMDANQIVGEPTQRAAAVVKFGLDGTVAEPTYSFVGKTVGGINSGIKTGMTLSGTDASPGVTLVADGVSVITFFKAQIYSPVLYASTLADPANLGIKMNGQMYRSTSARRYKTNIVDGAPLADLALAPVTFTHKESGTDWLGFIADDMPDDRMIERNADGEVENYDLRAVVAVLAAKVNRLEGVSA